jgi:heme/copper-type cytochrome/quinol oxidase subunit 1
MICWTCLITAYLLIAVMPVLAGAVTMTAHRPLLRHDASSPPPVAATR